MTKPHMPQRDGSTTDERIGDTVPGSTSEFAPERLPFDSASVRVRMVRLAYRFLWNQDDAEDVAQEALVTAYQRAASLRDKTKWWSWLSRIVVHRCHEHGRRKQRWERHEDGIRRATGSGVQDWTQDEPGDVKEQVRRLLEALPTRQREVTVLRHLQGMSYDEIANVLDISASTARVHARSGLETLRQLMNESRTTGTSHAMTPGGETT